MKKAKQLGLGKAGTEAKAMTESSNEVVVYYGQEGDTFEILAELWDIGLDDLIDMNRVLDEVNLQYKNLQRGVSPSISTKQPIIKRLLPRAHLIELNNDNDDNIIGKY